jgi:hypothetical protein
LAGFQRQAAAAGHGVARVQAQVEQRVLELAGVHHRRPQAGAAHGFDLDVLAQRAAQHRVQRGQRWLTSVARGSSACLRAKASSCCVSTRAALRGGADHLGQLALKAVGRRSARPAVRHCPAPRSAGC